MGKNFNRGKIVNITVFKTDKSSMEFLGRYEIFDWYIIVHEFEKVDGDWKETGNLYLFNQNIVEEIHYNRI